MVEVESKGKKRNLEFRCPGRADLLRGELLRLCKKVPGEISVMHVCGSHEQSIARFGLRSMLPDNLNVIMGPGCPVCVTDYPEVDQAVSLARHGATVATFGDMFRVPGSQKSLEEVKAEGADVKVIYSPHEAIELACRSSKEVVYFATGFETTAVATAAAIISGPPDNLSVLSAHKYIPPVMEIVAEMPQRRVGGFLAAGHAATVTGWKIFEDFVNRHRMPVVVAGFEPLDILAALVKLVDLIVQGQASVFNAYPRCCTDLGNAEAQKLLWRVFRAEGGNWRGIAHIPKGNLRLRKEYSHLDARCRFESVVRNVVSGACRRLSQDCICADIMSGIAGPSDCALFRTDCTPAQPVGACMVSNEGTCKIWYEYGGHFVKDPQGR